MENVLKRSRITLRNIQDVELGRPVFHHKTKNIILPRSSLNQPSQMLDNASNNRVDAIPLNSERVATVNADTHRTSEANSSLCNTHFVPVKGASSCFENVNITREDPIKRCISTVHQSCTCNQMSFRWEEVGVVGEQDEFDACFEGIAVNKDTRKNSSPRMKKCDLRNEEKFGRNNSNFLDETCGVIQLSDIYGTLSKHSDIKHEIIASKKIYKKTNVQDILLRTRNLTDVSSFQSTTARSQMLERNTKYNNVNTTLVGTRSNSVALKESYEHNWLNILGRGLAHGKEHEMSLALEILKKQYISSRKFNNQFSFLLDRICVQTVLGPAVENSCVLEGTVVELSEENHSIIACDSNIPRRIALVKGDVNFDYRHAGFKESVRVTRTLNKDDFYNPTSNPQNKWLDEVMSLIKRLNLGVVAIHGQMEKGLRGNLQTSDVIILENLNNCQLNALSKMTETPISSYILDFTEHNFGKQVVIKIWSGVRTKQSSKGRVVQTPLFGQVCLWPVQEALKSAVHSVLLCGPVQDLVLDSEQRFWNCVHRLHNTFEDQCVLPGGGNIEKICMKHLETIRGKTWAFS